MDVYRSAVSRFMASPVVAVRGEDELGLVDALLRTRRISAVLVLGQGGGAAGVISRRDLLRAGRGASPARRGEPAVLALPAQPASALMSSPVVAVAPEASVADACRALVDRHIHRVFVMDGDRPAGVFSTREAMAVVQEARDGSALGAQVTRALVAVETTTPLREALEALEQAGAFGVVVNEGTQPVGLFTEREALLARGQALTTPTEEVMTAALLCLPAGTPLFRAAGFALAMSARRIVVTERLGALGVVTGLDFAAVVAQGG